MYIHLGNNYFTLIKVKKTIGYNILQLLTKNNSIGSLVERLGLKIVTFDKLYNTTSALVILSISNMQFTNTVESKAVTIY